jgi:ribonuclease HI
MSFRGTPRTRSKGGTRELFEPSAGRPEVYLVAHIDGGARGNPGPAGYGAAIEDNAGHPVEQLREYLGKRTNNYAEYSGLLAAMRFALAHRFQALEVLSDSELLVRQMTGEYKVRHPELKLLYAEALALKRELKWFAIRHVRRELNRESDRLANLAMDEGTGRRESAPAKEITGVVRNGVVEFDGSPPPEGTRVKIRRG